MTAPLQFNVTYYVSMVLAYGGTLSIESDRLVFTPGAVERAVGVSNTEIPFNNIKMVEVTGTITESLVVRTPQKAHRFVGGEPHKIMELIEHSLENAPRAPSAAGITPLSPARASGSSAPVAAAASSVDASLAAPVSSASKSAVSASCPGCKASVRSDFLFCPHCSTVLKLSCGVCRKVVEQGWKFCAYCGVTFV